MNVKSLTDIGLGATHAKAYLMLIKNGSATPPDAALKLQMKRTNAYAVLDQLEELGLATKKDIKRKLTYFPTNPTVLEKIAKDKKAQALEHERLVQASMPTMLNYFYTFNNQPGVRFFQGVEGIKEIYSDMLRTGKDIYVVRSPYDQDLMSQDFYTSFKLKKAKLGITTHMINPKNNPAFWNEKTDILHKMVRTQVKPDQYDAESEISVYGNKVSIISFGEEAIGMIIDSPQISKAHRQLFELAKKGAQAK